MDTKDLEKNVNSCDRILKDLSTSRKNALADLGVAFDGLIEAAGALKSILMQIITACNEEVE